MKRRYGLFSIDRHFIDGATEVVRTVLSHCVVLRAEMMAMYDAIEYAAFSELFDEIDEGCIAPRYKVVTSKVGPLDQIVVSFVRDDRQ